MKDTHGKEVNRVIFIATLNIVTIKGQSNEIVKMLLKRQIDICGVQESRWRDESAGKVARINFLYKFFWKGDNSGNASVESWLRKSRLKSDVGNEI